MWGHNDSGELGDGTEVYRNIPVRIDFPNPMDTYTGSKISPSFINRATSTQEEADSEQSTATFKNLTPNDTYNFYAAKSLTAENLLSPDNLLYISQARADASGNMEVTYELREPYENAVIFAIGAEKREISNAKVSVPNLIYNGSEQMAMPTVTYNGKLLVEGRDYNIGGDFSATEIGNYTLTISGTGTYTGSVSVNYQVVCNHTYVEKITKQPTCTQTGEKVAVCSICGTTNGVTKIPKTPHKYGTPTITKKATTKADGTMEQKCTICQTKKTSTIYKIKTAGFTKSSVTYNGKNQKPAVVLKDSKGTKLKDKTDYTMTYPKQTKNIGTYTVTINLKGKYSGTIKKTFTIAPKGTSLTNLTVSGRNITAKWTKQTSHTTGYELQYSTSSKFTKKTTKTAAITKNKTTAKKLSKLAAKKKYYVRIRTYKSMKKNGKTTKIYSPWSKPKSVTTKK